jgi:fructosamine-3-kinase
MADEAVSNAPSVQKAWLAACLGRDAGELAAVEWVRVGAGQVAASYCGNLSWKGQTGPETVFIKVPSTDPKSREAGIKYNLYAREIAWYSVLKAKSQVNCPAYLGSWIDEETGEFALLLEDCAPAAQGDQIAGGSIEQVRIGLRELARLHSAFFNDPSIARDDLTRRNLEFSKRRVDILTQFWPVFRQRYADRLDKNILDIGDAFSKKFREFELRRAPDFSLIHGDFRLDNLLFTPDDAGAFVVDWQTLSENCPMKDVAYFIGTSFADAADRRTHEASLLDLYFKALGRSGANVNEEALRTEYRVQTLTGIAMSIISSVMVERTERGDELFALMAERQGHHAMDMDSLSLL